MREEMGMPLGAQISGDETSRFKPEVRRLIALARVLRWDVRWAGNQRQMVVMRSPVNTSKTINLPTTSINHNRWTSTMKQIVTHSDPEAIRYVVTGDFDLVKETDIAEIVVLVGPELLDYLAEEVGMDKPSEKTVPPTREVAEEVTVVQMPRKTAVAEAMEEAQAKAAVEPPGYTGKPTKGSKVDAAPERVIVSERPWLARKGGKDGAGGVVYESPVVNVVTYSDGTETFKCKFCDVTSDNPRSISGHSNRGHSAEVKQMPAATPLLRTDHYEKSDIARPTRTAIARLANDLVAALDGVESWQAMDASDLAHTLARRVVEGRPEHHVNSEPLTSEQVIARITSLVDNGRLAEMSHQMEQMAASLAEQTARADRAAGNLQALKDMLNSEES
jgi:hypothetical protein